MSTPSPSPKKSASRALDVPRAAGTRRSSFTNMLGFRSKDKKPDDQAVSVETDTKDSKDTKEPITKEPTLWGLKEINEQNFEQAMLFVKTCIKWFREKKAVESTGVFRKAGNEEDIIYFKQIMAEGVPDNFNFPPEQEVHVVTSLFKRFFREIKNPLLTHALYTDFIAAESEEEDKRQKAIQVVLDLLPKPNKLLLYTVCEYLHEVAKYSDENMMGAHNLAIVFAPNLLRPAVEKPSTLIADAGHSVTLVETFIEEYDTLLVEQKPAVEVTVEPEVKEKEVTEMRAGLQSRYTLHRTKSKAILTNYCVEKRFSKETQKMTLKELSDRIMAGETDVQSPRHEEANLEREELVPSFTFTPAPIETVQPEIPPTPEAIEPTLREMATNLFQFSGIRVKKSRVKETKERETRERASSSASDSGKPTKDRTKEIQRSESNGSSGGDKIKLGTSQKSVRPGALTRSDSNGSDKTDKR